MNDQEIIESRLGLVNKVGMIELIRWLADEDFYQAPASTRYHGCYQGGLAHHSLGVYRRFELANRDLQLDLEDETVILTALLHDVCKIGAYIGSGPYIYNETHPEGHGILSVKRIKQFIDLTDLEEKMILYHMGVYRLTEFNSKMGEYPLRNGGLTDVWEKYPAVKIIYFCDEMATIAERVIEGIGG